MPRMGLEREDAKYDEYERVADRWRPYRSIGSWYMWRALDLA